MNFPKRLIEVDLPIKRISAHARREKSIRHGHISTLHIWWARRPLAACRAVICASLWPDPVDITLDDVEKARKDGRALELNICPQTFRDTARKEMLGWTTHERQKLLSPESRIRFERARKNPAIFSDSVQLRGAILDFIADFANWDNSNVREYLDTSHVLTESAHRALGGAPSTRPLVVDPFAGGGSIPLEALRVGADAYASDLNPVAVLLNKVVLEYIPAFGPQLAKEVRTWGEWIIDRAEQELAQFYPIDADGSEPIAYMWARTIRCEGPGCGAEIPLFRTPCLAQGRTGSVFLVPLLDQKRKSITFKVESSESITPDSRGFLKRSSVTCPLCGYTTPGDHVRKQFKGRQGGANDARLLAVVTRSPGNQARRYRVPNENDQHAVSHAVQQLDELRNAHPGDIPTEPLPYLRSIFNINLLDVTQWGQLFSARQLASLLKLVRLVRELRSELLKVNMDPKLGDAVVSCVALAVDRVAAQFSSLSWWQPKGEFVVGTFGRQALGIVWDYAEVRPVNGASGDLNGALNWITRVIESGAAGFGGEATVTMASALHHPLPDDSVSAVVTDPPYYDAVPYADLSDFFYVFLKRMLRETHPTIFSELLSPKEGEVVQLAERNPIYAYKTKDYFERGMSASLAEARRITAPEGICVVVFAHKTTQGWEVMLSSIINAGWTVTASWPIDTERAVRMRANDSAALASSVHLVCRPRQNPDGSLRNDEVGDWRDVLQELPRRIHEWMPRLGEEAVVGADAIFACLGPALEIFSRYSRVEKASGEVVSLKDYLEHVWAAVSQEALSTIFAGASTEGFEPDARLTAMWLWTLSSPNTSDSQEEGEQASEEDEDEVGSKKIKGGFALEYDAARKIAQGLGAHLEDLSSLIEVSGDTARLLSVAERTEHLFGKEQAQAPVRRKSTKSQLDLFSELTKTDDVEMTWSQKAVSKTGETTLDRIHQSMILFAASRGEALRRFLVDDGVGKDQRFWSLSNALAALYPRKTDERRWVEGVLARKKGLGL